MNPIRLFWLFSFFLLIGVSFTFAGQIPSCQNLSTPNEYYTLTKDLSIDSGTCFSISAENITLDCAGHSIRGDNSYGIYSNQFNTTIKNCNISGFYYGIYLDSALNATVYNNTISGHLPNGYGIYLWSTTYSSIISNTVKTQKSHAIFLRSNSSNNIVSSNIASSLHSAIRLESGSNYNIVSNNNASSPKGGQGIYLSDSNYNIFANNTATSVSGYGFGIRSSSYNNITNLEASSDLGAGIYIHQNSIYNTITNSTASSNLKYGLYLIGSYDNTIAYNVIDGYPGSGGVMVSDGNNVYGNTVNGKPDMLPSAGIGVASIDMPIFIALSFVFVLFSLVAYYIFFARKAR